MIAKKQITEANSLLLRTVLRPVDRTLTSVQANAIRNRIYDAVHEVPMLELI
ncbi:hypothetical protein [Nocardia sp. NPDC019395]|uniref:hypothetical protein n=1 Tax=Nocardia sp. NPDC019395 TaxID=3154686 RepID=UPI0033DE3585